MSKRKQTHEMDIDDDDDNGDEPTPDLVDVNFDYYNVNASNDYHAVHRLFVQLFGPDAERVKTGPLTELVATVAEESGVGSTIKTEEEEGSDPYAVLTVISCRDHPGLQTLIDYMLLKSSSDQGFHDTLSSLLHNHTECHVGLVLSERLINMPVQVMAPMYRMLSEEIDEAIQDGQGYRFTHYLFVSRVYRLTAEEEEAMLAAQRNSKRYRSTANTKLNTSGVYGFHPEDEEIIQHATHTMTFEFTDAPARDADSVGLDVAGRLMLVPAENWKEFSSRNVEIIRPSFLVTSMALLAPSDWHPPRDHTMDPSIPRQRSSPANDHSSSNHPQQSLQQHAQPPYPYPVQQSQPSWNPPVSAQPFYPSFYQNQHQQLPAQPYPLHPHQSQNPYFDPTANAQLAQWAYQHMMFNAQAQMGSHPPNPQRSGSSSAPASPAEYFSPNQLFNHFPSGTPPPHQQHPPHHAPGYTHRTASADAPRSQPQYEGFHPYRRPPNPVPGRSQESDWRPSGSFQPPYARGEASASSTSVNSSNSNHGNGNGNGRQRTSSIQGQSSSHSHPNGSSSHQGSVRGRSSSATQTIPQPPPSAPDATRTRTGSGSSTASANTPNPSRSPSAHPLPHHRTGSSSSAASSAPAHRPSGSISASPTSAPSSHSHHPSHSTQARPTRPSPLSQGSTYTTTSPPLPSPTPRAQTTHASAHADRRISRDDSGLATMLENSAIGLGGTSAVKSGGLKGRLRRALSLNAAQALQEEDDSAHTSAKTNGSEAPSPTDANDASSTITEGTVGTAVGGSGATTGPTAKKRSRAASLFNSRLNASTDNISLSSTMSSASVVIRKIGSIGKLARRNSLAGITSLFKEKKDKEKEKDGDAEAGSSSGKKPKKKKDAKGSVAEPAVSHAVAELDRGSGSGGDWSDSSLSGLSPAAKLARQHTLKSNAEAAARAKAAVEAQAQATQAEQAKSASGSNGSGVPVPSTWEKNTTTARGDSPGPGRRIAEDGTRVIVEDDSDSGSEDGHGVGYSAPQGQSYISEGWDDDEPWPEEEDETIRIAVGSPADEDEVLEWAKNMRRTIDKSRAPAKGILKGAENYNQASHIPDQAGITSFNRIRSNSYNSHPGPTSELGPLARIPSPDPDHIDGLHRHPSHSSSHSNAHAGNVGGNIPSLPALSFTSSSDSSPSSDSEAGRSSPHHGTLFSLPNSSAPALSTIPTVPATVPHRSTSGPATTRKLVFADSLSVYDTFSSSVYDRRSEPATWSRLTPALAQRIKEELNSYKMEEMEVHACSRMHTQFFI
ncbi:p21-C-terminal region-binding protein-domain-containing protein [Boletus edulis BED1]|uniref:P21-C-terminal region-binding protein-domain-containing protein n=1 Tax=Boletus edulis BED1 TaxID=1328754 RepID=A0AAD4BTQ0_BOLED|nr:p21-C-terminal region-binding protein-domain-containing protein [Boletus edulis BED1]